MNNSKKSSDDATDDARIILGKDGERFDVSMASLFNQISSEKALQLFDYLFPNPVPKGSQNFLEEQANKDSFDPELNSRLFGTLTHNWVGLEDMLLSPSSSNLASYVITVIERENLSENALAFLKALLEALDETGSSEYKLTVSQRKRGRPYKALTHASKSMLDLIYALIVDLDAEQFGKKEAAVQALMDEAALQRSQVFGLLAKAKEAGFKPPEQIRIPYGPYEPPTIDLPYSLCKGDIKLD